MSGPFSIAKPTPADLDAFLAKGAAGPFTYPFVGLTLDGRDPPPGWDVDRNRVDLGRGPAVFEAARLALARWTMFRLGWVETHPADLPIATGAVVAVVARSMGIWVRNACRVVGTVDDRDGPVWRSGFAYGTLADHVERGEERFLIEWDRSTDAVAYDILAVSRPSHPLARLAYGFTRRAQRRFARDSKRAMADAVVEHPSPT